ncbi:arginine--tRNA ligase [Halocatena pleomorpha]|uniref:Arginine--tRNA ligase n=1 Tax=Halocatena pleomorpha TaxID=1785090 RepID=A0A3P3RCZ0_9EURY|nr:arginine--tRNA ligase [Halocatena pleomorpha]RRJ30333.1 arginine--tRNA ligase [Halocatena pleomorpha]
MLQVLRDHIIEDMTTILEEWGCAAATTTDPIEINEYTDAGKGLLATPIAFQLASELGRPPADIAADLADAFRDRGPIEGIDTIETAGGYINFHIDETFTTQTLERILDEGSEYGVVEGTGTSALFEFSSPNIAKPLHIGHLRNTVLGDVLGNVLAARGYDLVRDNHIGDWGVQFGHLLYEFEQAEDTERFEAEPIDYLLELYQRYGRHETELEESGREADVEQLRDTGREYFAALESGDAELRALWERFSDASRSRFDATYDRLGVDFDTWHGESFYVTESWTSQIRETAIDNGIAIETDDGAYVVPIYDDDLTNVEDPEQADVRTDADIDLDEDDGDYEAFVITKRDGTTTYGTRDLATIAYRVEQGYDELLYVVGSEQREYFQQLFAAARKLGYTDIQFTHVDYGLIDLPEGSMSTRAGRLITAEDVLDRVRENARSVVEENDLTLDEETADEIADGVALGTVRFENIAKRRTKNTTFDTEQATSLEGDTGPYVQYAATRAWNILHEADTDVSEPSAVADQPFNEFDHQLAVRLARYPLVLERCEERYDPAPLAQYLLDLARTFNKFYHENRVLDAEQSRERRLVLVAATVEMFETAFEITGIPMLKRM